MILTLLLDFVIYKVWKAGNSRSKFLIFLHTLSSLTQIKLILKKWKLYKFVTDNVVFPSCVGFKHKELLHNVHRLPELEIQFYKMIRICTQISMIQRFKRQNVQIFKYQSSLIYIYVFFNRRVKTESVAGALHTGSTGLVDFTHNYKN